MAVSLALAGTVHMMRLTGGKGGARRLSFPVLQGRVRLANNLIASNIVEQAIDEEHIVKNPRCRGPAQAWWFEGWEG